MELLQFTMVLFTTLIIQIIIFTYILNFSNSIKILGTSPRILIIFIFYFVNYKGQIFANQLAQDFEVKLMQKVISSSNPEYEKESKSKIFNMHNNDIYSIYALSNYLTMIPVDILEVIVIVGILFRSVYKELHADRETGC